MNVEARIRTFITENFVLGGDAGGLGAEDSLMDQGIVDSTGVLELVAFLQDDFGLEIADDEILPENLDSIANLCAFVARKSS